MIHQHTITLCLFLIYLQRWQKRTLTEHYKGYAVSVVIEAARLGVPAATLGRMGLNILTEVILGTIPMVGDFFDVVWKANARNVTLLERHIRNPRPSSKADKVFAAVMITGLLMVVLGAATLSILFVRWVLQL